MESNDRPEIPDRGETSDLPGLPSGEGGERERERTYDGIKFSSCFSRSLRKRVIVSKTIKETSLEVFYHTLDFFLYILSSRQLRVRESCVAFLWGNELRQSRAT